MGSRPIPMLLVRLDRVSGARYVCDARASFCSFFFGSIRKRPVLRGPKFDVGGGMGTSLKKIVPPE